MGDDSAAEDDGDDGDGGPPAADALACDRCGRLLAVQAAVVTAQAEVLCRACFDERVTPAPSMDSGGGAG